MSDANHPIDLTCQAGNVSNRPCGLCGAYRIYNAETCESWRTCIVHMPDFAHDILIDHPAATVKVVRIYAIGPCNCGTCIPADDLIG